MSLNRDVGRINQMSQNDPPSVAATVGIILGTVLVAFTLLFCGILYSRQKRKNGQVPEQIPATPPPDYPLWQEYNPAPPANYDYNYYLKPANQPAYPAPQGYNDSYYTYPYAYSYVNCHLLHGNFSANAGTA